MNEPKQEQVERIAAGTSDLLIALRHIAITYGLKPSEILLILLEYAVQFQHNVLQEETK